MSAPYSSARELGRADREPHDLVRNGRERDADGELGDADAAAAVRHDPPVACAGEDAAAGDGMPVDRRDDRLRHPEHRFERVVEAIEELGSM